MAIRIRLFLLVPMAIMISVFTLSAAPASAHDNHKPVQRPAARPELPNELTLGTTHFLIHYTTSGEHAVDMGDSDSSGVPDYVEAVAESAEYVWAFQIDEYGWTAPPPDQGRGGDDRLDIYLEEVMGEYEAAGYTEMEGGATGDNPNSADVERRAAYSYISLDDDYAELDDEDIDTIEYLQSTLAHEFNHAVQAGYDAYDAHSWLYESTATWMEEETYPDLNGGTIYFLEDTFGMPDACLVAESGWYGNYALMKMIDERYGAEVIRIIWENMRAREGFDAIDMALEPLDTSLAQEVRDYGVAILLRDYEEGALYPGVYLEGSANEGEFTPNNGVQSLGVDFIRVRMSGMIDVALNGDLAVLHLRGVGIRGEEADVIDAADGRITLNSSAYDEVYMLVQNTDQIEDEGDCADDEYSINVAASSGAATPVTVVRSAAFYGTNQITEPPDPDDEDEPESGLPFGGSSAGATTTTTDLDVSFPTVIPVTPPEGYTFTSAYVWTPEDFGEAAPYYMPGAEESANYDYVNAENHTLRVTESPSPYSNIPDWLVDIDYDTPGEFIDVAGTQVLIEDLSDDNGPWYSATLIYDGLFIVIDSDNNREVVLEMVELVLGSEPGAAQPDATPTVAATPTIDSQTTQEPTPSGAVSEDGLIAGLSALTVLLCCTGLCVVGGAIGLGVFLFMRRKPQG